jgi:hypothetical protein
LKPTLTQLRRLVGNPNAFAVQHTNGVWEPARKPLNDTVLQQHLDEELTVGTYVGVGDQSHLFVVDIDEDDSRLVVSVCDALHTLGVPTYATGTEESGRKGYHVWVVLQADVLARDLRRLGRAVLALSGLPSNTEVFPKQDEVRDLGNLVKLPGGVHRVTGRQNNFVGPVPQVLPVAVFDKVLAALPPEVNARRSGPSDTRFPCMECIQEEGVEEGGRNIQLFHLATMLRRNGVSEPNVEAIIRRANELGDPLSEEEVENLLYSSQNSGPLCEQLPEERQCGDLCIKQRIQGLYTRAGQLRFAADGEPVVVTLKSRRGGVVIFDHDDLRMAKGSLR